jgi:hypothetical protein
LRPQNSHTGRTRPDRVRSRLAGASSTASAAQTVEPRGDHAEDQATCADALTGVEEGV